MKGSAAIPAHSRHGVGPFVTWILETCDDGLWLIRTSRRHRKGQPALVATTARNHPHTAALGIGHDWRRVLAHRRLSWWIAILFMIGAAHFALGSAPEVFTASALDTWLPPRTTAWVFFIGSLFFTSAAYLQWLEAINHDLLTASPAGGHRRWRFFAWQPLSLGFVATATQLIGTLLFNANTGDALLADLDWRHQDMLVWSPNILGSLCFLIASQAALMEVSHAYWSWRPKDLSWWIAIINLSGSLFFMLSAVASFVRPGSLLTQPWLASFGTFAGALCFFVAAYLLIPEIFEKRNAPPVGSAA